MNWLEYADFADYADYADYADFADYADYADCTDYADYVDYVFNKTYQTKPNAFGQVSYPSPYMLITCLITWKINLVLSYLKGET